MNPRIIAGISLFAVVVASVVSFGCVNAVGPVLNLPQTPITVRVYDGTKSRFDTVLSGVPSGYDVGNGRYPGWCVDLRYAIQEGPFTATLYSSQSSPPLVANQKWDMVNYVLNHKNGSAWDVQQAIWYFVNMIGNYSPTTTKAWAMVDDAKANGMGFVPGIGQVTAVICYPLPATQITVIEVLIKSPLLADINNDGVVDISDAMMLAGAFHARPGDPNWNPSADLNNDAAIDIFDAMILAANFGKTLT